MLRFYALMVMVLAGGVLKASPADRWLHVRVDDRDQQGEQVRVNVPLELAEKVLPCIHADRLHGGKLNVEGDLKGVDVHALLKAVRSTADGEFVTVQSRDENVRVAKQSGFIIVKVREKHDQSGSEMVDIKVPFAVAEALLSGKDDQLDFAAGLRALKAAGDTELVNVTDDRETVHIWVDSRRSAE